MDIEKTASTIYVAHALISTALKMPELMMTEEACKELAQAVAGLASEYDMVINTRAAAWANLLAVAGILYIPRIYAIGQRLKTQHSQNNGENPHV